MTETDPVPLLVALGIAVVTLALAIVLRRGVLWIGRRAAGLGRAALARIAGSRALKAARPVNDLIAARYPRLHRLVAARLRPDRFTGLPLTLLAAAAGYMAALFGGLIDELLEADEVVSFDEAVNDALDPLRLEPFLSAFVWITDLAASPAVTAVAIVSTAFLWVAGRRPAIAGLWTTLLGSELTTHTGKLLIRRTRPEFLEAASETSFAFPSGHATAAVAVYGFLAYVLAGTSLPGTRRFDIAYWLAVVILLICFSRIYLRVHFVTDVAGGLLVGGFWLLVGVAAAEWLRVFRPTAARDRTKD